MAALIASGTSTISGLPFLERGYENIVKKLEDLNADVSLTKPSQSEKSLVLQTHVLDALEPLTQSI